MSARDDIRADLQRAARDGRIRSKSQAFESVEAGLSLFLTEIEQCVLGRELTFDLSSGAQLVCLAGGRRLLRCLPPIPSGLGSDHASLFETQELGNRDLALCASALKTLFTDPGNLRISTAAPKSRIEVTADIGLSAAALADASGIRLESAGTLNGAESDIIEAFIDALGEKIAAAVLIEGEEVVLVAGATETANDLSDWATTRLEHLLDPSFPLAAGLETDGILVFPRANGAQRLLIGNLGNFLAVESLSDSSTEPLALWRDLKSQSAR